MTSCLKSFEKYWEDSGASGLFFEWAAQKRSSLFSIKSLNKGSDGIALKKGGILATMINSMIPRAKRSTEKPE